MQRLLQGKAAWFRPCMLVLLALFLAQGQTAAVAARAHRPPERSALAAHHRLLSPAAGKSARRPSLQPTPTNPSELNPTTAPTPAPTPTTGPASVGPDAAVVQSASGQTTLEVTPLVVLTGEQVTIHVTSERFASVLCTINYPDGHTITRRGRINADGVYILRLWVSYAPLDRSAVAGVTVSVARGAAFAESVQTTFTVQRPSLLARAILHVRPAQVRAGQSLIIGVWAPLPYVQVHVTVLDPSQQSTSTDGSTNARGLFVAVIPVSYQPASGQSDATLLVSAVLSYQGQTRLLQQAVPVAATR